MGGTIYLDHVNATPLLPEAYAAMRPYLMERFGNPQSRHAAGQAAREALDEARGRVAGLIGAAAREMTFTASGTEANNLAIKGAARAYKTSLKKRGRHLVTTRIEHPSVLNAVKALVGKGEGQVQGQTWDATIIPVDETGRVDPAAIAAAIRDDTVLVSVTQASHEIGTIQPLAEIGRITRARGVLLHTDAVASAGLIPVDVEALGVDLLTLSASTFYGPKGAAALYCRQGVRLQPILDGGVQERGRRPGQENVPSIVGMGAAASVARVEQAGWAAKMTAQRDRLMRGLETAVEGVRLTGHRTFRLPHVVSLVVEYVDGDALRHLLDQQGIAVASGSSCTPAQLKASEVLLAIGIPPDLAQGALLFGLGKDTTDGEIMTVLEQLPLMCRRLQDLSPVYVSRAARRREAEIHVAHVANIAKVAKV